MSSRDLLYRARLGFPWVIALLSLSCLLVTAPLFIEPRRFYLTLGVGFCEEDGVVRWWHHLVTNFVHGAGCWFPPTWFHLGVNVALFIFQGALVERVLGAGRVALLTFSCLIVHIVLVYLLVDGRGHGASGMTWSYLLFAIHWLVRAWKTARWRMFADWVTCALVLLSLFATLGLIKHWHLWNLLVSVPFYLAWRKTFASNLDDLSGADHGRGNAVGVTAAALVLAFNAYFVAAAVGGQIQPQVVESAFTASQIRPMVTQYKSAPIPGRSMVARMSPRDSGGTCRR